MRKISLSSARPGQVLARPVFDLTGNLLLGRGIQLNSKFIQRMEAINIASIYIDDPLTEGIEIPELLSDETHRLALAGTSRLLNRFQSKGELNPTEVQKSISQIIEEILMNRHAKLDLLSIRQFDDYTFSHSLAVCVLALLIGTDLGYNRFQLQELGLGALMHDIGKLNVPATILNKPSQLDEHERRVMENHSNLGFEILRNKSEIKLCTAHVALQHQEKYDGSGYPRGLCGSDIHEYARITAVADVFDALTSKRAYRSPLPLHEAYEYLLGQGGRQFDQALLKSFSRVIAVYPEGSVVILSNGMKAVVAKQNTGYPLRPQIKVVLPNVQIIDINLISPEYAHITINGIDNNN